MPQTMIFKVTENCNMACRYCYVGEFKNKHKISAENARLIIGKWVEFEGKEKPLHIIFHGGEPMLAGLDFYKQVIPFVEDLNQKGYKIKLGMQSNGTLFTDESLNYLLTHKVGIGLSLDGDEVLHDKTRVLKSGKSSYDSIVATIEKIKQINGRVGVIMVITKYTISRLKETYEHFKGLGITSVKFHELMADTAPDLIVSEDELNDRLIDLFHYWMEDPAKIKPVEPFSEIIEGVLCGQNSSCCSSATCQKDFLGVDSEGFVLPCNRFSGEEWHYGNVFQESFDTIANCGLRQKLLDKSKFLDLACQSCQFIQICHGGCLFELEAMRLKNGERLRKNPACLKRLFSDIYENMDRIIKLSIEGAP